MASTAQFPSQLFFLRRPPGFATANDHERMRPQKRDQCFQSLPTHTKVGSRFDGARVGSLNETPLSKIAPDGRPGQGQWIRNDVHHYQSEAAIQALREGSRPCQRSERRLNGSMDNDNL